EESAVGASQVFKEITTRVRHDARMLARYEGGGVVISQVKMRENLARQAPAANIERVLGDSPLPQNSVRPQHLELTGRATRDGGSTTPAEVSARLAAVTADHAQRSLS